MSDVWSVLVGFFTLFGMISLNVYVAEGHLGGLDLFNIICFISFYIYNLWYLYMHLSGKV